MFLGGVSSRQEERKKLFRAFFLRMFQQISQVFLALSRANGNCNSINVSILSAFFYITVTLLQFRVSSYVDWFTIPNMFNCFRRCSQLPFFGTLLRFIRFSLYAIVLQKYFAIFIKKSTFPIPVQRPYVARGRACLANKYLIHRIFLDNCELICLQDILERLHRPYGEGVVVPGNIFSHNVTTTSDMYVWRKIQAYWIRTLEFDANRQRVLVSWYILTYKVFYLPTHFNPKVHFWDVYGNLRSRKFRCAFVRSFKRCNFKSFRDYFPQCFITIIPGNRSEASKPVK